MQARWSRRFYLQTTFAAVLVFVGLFEIGCTGQPGSGGNDNGAGNDPPPGQSVEIVVTMEGQGNVSQTSDGSRVTLTATPEDGWRFDIWTGSAVSDENENDNPLILTATVSMTLHARFVPDVDGGSLADGDGDGVPDNRDICRATPSGSEVDAQGCGRDQVDSDGDTVDDENDQCPGTPTGASVDEQGCSPSQADADSDGVNDEADDCPDTPDDATVDSNGCPSDDPDSDGDGVLNADDRCAGTPAAAEVDMDGCTASQLDADDDGVSNLLDLCTATPDGAAVDSNGCAATERDSDGDGVNDDRDQCANTASGRLVDANGCPVADSPPGGGGNPEPPAGVCERSAGGCFRANPTPGCNEATCCGLVCSEDVFCCDDQWDTLCAQSAARLCGGSDLGNDACASPQAIAAGSTPFSTLEATTDGPDEGGACGTFDITADIWFCYTAACTGFTTVSLCGSQYDTTLAVYNGCGCPSAPAIACSDDDCGPFGLDSRLTFAVVSGQAYMVRVGGYASANGQGTGNVTIQCGDETGTIGTACNAGSGDCFSGHDNAGCDNSNCCQTVCETDPFCCDVEWDDYCSREAGGLCSGAFEACAGSTNACGTASDSAPGCNNPTCCESVCRQDPFCCLEGWDGRCVERASQCP